MNIGVLGAGNVGKILGEGFVKSGHRVLISSREPHNLKHVSWKQKVGESGDITSFDEAARFARSSL